jgi:hypothetical protein
MHKNAAIIELNAEEADVFSSYGDVMKTLPELPKGVFIGAPVQVGHWKAEVTSIEPHEGEFDSGFVVGLRLLFS